MSRAAAGFGARVVDAGLTALARAGLARGRAIVTLDAARLDRHLRLIAAILRRVDRAHPALPGVAELRELIASDPVALPALRKLLGGARDEQAVSTIRGALRHHVWPWPLVQRELLVPPRPRPARKLSALRVGLVGASADLDDLEVAYRDAGATVTRAASVEAVDWPRFLERVNAVELGGGAAVAVSTITAALDRGVAVSLHRAAARDAAELEALRFGHVAALARFRIFDPLLWYPPFTALAELLERDVLGEVTTIRVRALIGGGGTAARPGEPLDPACWERHPAFDRFLALACLGGPLASLTGYARFEGAPGRAGGAVLALAHAHPGRYSHLELAYAPELEVRSSREPHDLSVEVSGTDGIAWLRRGPAKRVEQAPLEVRVGKLHFTVDAAAGLDESWGAAFRAAAQALERQVVGGRPRPPLAPPAWCSALAARDAAPLATRLGNVVRL